MLEQDLDTEVVIIGGGLTGVMSAYLLAKAGASVVLLERGKLGKGATSATTAFITQIIDLGLTQLKDLFGEEKAQQLWAAGRQAIDLIEEIVRAESIECEFKRCPLYLYGTSEQDFSRFKKEDELARKLGFSTRAAKDNALGFSNSGYLEVSHQAKFSAGKFLRALAKKAEALGAKIFEESEVIEVSSNAREVRTAKAIVRAKNVIMATHLPINKPKLLPNKKALYKSYVIEATVPRGILAEAMYVDSNNPYHYVRVDQHGTVDRLMVGGSDHRQDIPVSEKKSFASLERFTAALLPGISFQVVSKWSGPLIESTDGLPYIGEYAPHQFVGTAYSGNGMTYSVIAAQIFRDAILDKSNPFAQLYDPMRQQTLKQILTNSKHYIGEFFGGVVRNTLSL